MTSPLTPSPNGMQIVRPSPPSEFNDDLLQRLAEARLRQPAAPSQSQQQPQQPRPQQTAPRTAQSQQRPGRPDNAGGGRVSSAIGSAKSSVKNGISYAIGLVLFIVTWPFRGRQRFFATPLFLAALIGVGYLLTKWVAPNLKVVGVIAILLMFVIFFELWSAEWRLSLIWRSVIAVILTGIAGAAIMFNGSMASIVSSIPLLGNSGTPVVLQPERGNVTEQSFGVIEDGKFGCSVNQTVVTATDAGMFNGVPFTVVTNEQGMTIKFSDKPVGLGGFVAENRAVPLTGVNSPNGSNSFVFTKGPFTKVPSTAAMCWVE